MTQLFTATHNTGTLAISDAIKRCVNCPYLRDKVICTAYKKTSRESPAGEYNTNSDMRSL